MCWVLGRSLLNRNKNMCKGFIGRKGVWFVYGIKKRLAEQRKRGVEGQELSGRGRQVLGVQGIIGFREAFDLK